MKKRIRTEKIERVYAGLLKENWRRGDDPAWSPMYVRGYKQALVDMMIALGFSERYGVFYVDRLIDDADDNYTLSQIVGAKIEVG